MHLSVDSTRSLAAVRVALLAALVEHGLAVERVTPTPAGGFVVEVVDPLPGVRAATDGTRDRSTWKVAGYARADGGSRLSTLNPTHLVDLLDETLAEAGARALERTLTRALFAAAGRASEAPEA